MHRAIVALVLGPVGLVVAAGLATSSPALCGSCHEMAPRTAAWKSSAHAEVGCFRCHVSPRPWYAFPRSMYAKATLLRRDVYQHVLGRYEDPVETRVAGVPPMADEVCLQCHDPNRKATSGFRILIEHGEHAKRNKSCVSCHVRTAHPQPTRGKALSLMAQCYTCHGLEKTAIASASCDLCHPSDFEPEPASHRAKRWKRGHGGIAKADRRQCEMCHITSWCDGCHGLEMPHPGDWAQGKTSHAVYAKRDRTVCSRCHESKPDLCSMCHHKTYDPKKGDWVDQHPLEARKEGPGFCLGCHSPLDCARCHVQG